MRRLSFFRTPTSVIYGIGAAQKAGEAVRNFGVGKVLLVTDKGVSEAGLTNGVKSSLRTAGMKFAIFDKVEPNPSIETVEAGLLALRESAAEIIVGVGGGSVIDTSKAIAILATNGGRISDYEGVDKVPQPALPVIGLPTTAGTGSEVTINVVVTDRVRKFKFTIVSPNAAARLAILDPLLTVSMSPRLTAAVGIDTLAHAIESYVSLASYPVTESLALGAIRLVACNLPTAVAHGDDLQARDNMLMACLMASLAFSNTRLGNCHAMSHPLGGYFDIPHGIANAILLPHVMEFNLTSVPQKFIDIAVAMSEEVAGLPVEEAAFKAVSAVKHLCEQIGIPGTLREVGVQPEAIPAMAQDAMKSGNILVNPRKTELGDIVRLFEKAL
ncbi:MAG: iron-containing alcohol dehydrogenase [Chloroflexi bacterium]|nr:iron-containing alcohol dehydrogenase [Chloroflexota bacterium]MCL5075684.1 iron-containing alcohol dehydrogenase [Chloroflexota bacterium]